MIIPVMDEVTTVRINGLIPDAVLAADESVPLQVRLLSTPQRWPDAVKDIWNQVYHETMDRLAKEAKLRY